MSIGVTVAFVLAFIGFAIVMSLLQTPESSNESENNLILQKLALITDKKGRLIIVSFAIVAFIAIFGVSKLSVENSFINYFKKNTEIYQGLNFIDKELGGTIPLEIVFNDLALSLIHI